MRESIQLTVDDESVVVPEGITVAAALLRLGKAGVRRSTSGELRGPVCGMGVCFECRVMVNGRSHVRSCQTICEPGMEIRTDE
jgi:predicted molibdopterin-dependent oxidoreductase YjgC